MDRHTQKVGTEPTMTEQPRSSEAGGTVVGRLGLDPRIGVMAPRATRLYQLLSASELVLLMRLRLMYLDRFPDQEVQSPDDVPVVSLELRDVECAAMIGVGLTKLAQLRQAISYRKTPLAILIPGVTPIKERYFAMEIVRSWRWSFYLFDPDITPDLLERARVLDPNAHDPQRRRESYTEALARLEPQVLAKSNAKAAKERRGQAAGQRHPPPAKTTEQTPPDGLRSYPEEPRSSGSMEPASLDSAQPGTASSVESSTAALTEPVSSETTQPRQSLIELAGFTKIDKNNKQHLHVKQHVLHAEKSNSENKGNDSASLPLRNVARDALGRQDELHPTYKALGNALKDKKWASEAEVDDFEWFLQISLHEKFNIREDLDWRAYVGYFRLWQKLGDARATAIAGGVAERWREGSVANPCAYLMSELRRESGDAKHAAKRRTGS